jgi:hypothetical protein
MEIHNLTPFQQDLADTLWDCENEHEVQAVIDEFGNPAFTVYQLMIAAHYDDAIQDHNHVELAQQVIDNLCK